MRASAPALAAVLLSLAPPAAATPVRSSAVDPAAALSSARERIAAGDCAGALGLLDPLVSGQVPPGDRMRIGAQLLRLPCLASAGRGRDAAAVVAELRRTAPDNATVRAFAVLDDAEAGRTAAAADGLASLADAGSPALRLIPGSLWRVIAQRLTQAGDGARRDRLALSLARASWTPADDPDLAEAIAAEGIAAALDQHDGDTAAALLDRVRDPATLVSMAIERRYAMLWPAIERRLGAASGTAIDRYARTALDGFARTPDDDRARRDAVHAFVALERPADVVATAAPVGVAEGMGEDRVLIVLAHAQALTASGDRAGAIARLQPLAALDPRRTPEAAIGVISLAEADHDAGRYADELDVARAALGRPETALSPFGVGWLRRNEACALAALDRPAEAKAAGDGLIRSAGDNQAAAIEGLLCLHRDDEAAAIAVRTLAAPDGADRLADQFQPAGALFLASPSPLRASWARLLARRDVRAAFDRAARILPEAMWPKRDRALPAPPVDADPGGTVTT